MAAASASNSALRCGFSTCIAFASALIALASGGGALVGYAPNHHRQMQMTTMFVPALRRKSDARSIVVAKAVRIDGILYVGSSSTMGRAGPRRIVRRTIHDVPNAAIAPRA